MYTYIKRNTSNIYIELEELLSPENYNNLGESYEDYLANKWVLLSDELVQFHLNNPNASIKEVLGLELDDVLLSELTLEDTISNKLTLLYSYDNSSEVNEFTINGELKTWFTPDQRANYKNSIDSAKLLGIESLQLLINGNLIELSTEKAAQLLAMIQLYADACYIVTEKHKTAIQSMKDMVEIEDYDFTVGYPKKLNFEV